MVSEISSTQKIKPALNTANSPLKRAVRLLFAFAVAGQWLFVGYIVAFYGGVVWRGDYEKINEQLVHGVIAGDFMGNLMLAAHIALAAVITFGGPLQFMTFIRNRFPGFHRWTGRIYFVTAFLISFAGLYMNFTRGAHGGIFGAMGNGLNAVLIMSFSVLAWRTAMQRSFDAHKKWAMRAFLMVSGVWFFRLGFGIWILITGFTVPGTTADLTGPFDRFLMFGHSIVPLLILEFYYFAKANPSGRIQKMATVFFSLLSVLMVAGIVMLLLVFWLPQL